MHTNLTEYYAKRAAEYEAIYAKPERQADLEAVATFLKEIFNGKDVLEIACGTGFWTEKIARTARSVWATDINESVLEIARNKNYPNKNVRFEATDLYYIQSGIPVKALFGGFIWSHIPVQELSVFVRKANSLVPAGGTIAMMDNRFVEGSSTPVSGRDEWGNSYQQRQLQNGESYRILKNFPAEADIKRAVERNAVLFQLVQFQYFWMAVWQTGSHP